MSRNLVTGQRQLKKRLDALQARLESQVIPHELAQAAETFAAQVRDNAPFLTGALAGSVEVEVKTDKPGVYAIEVTVTGGHDDPIVAHIEFGRLHEEPNPFIRRSFAQVVRQVKAEIKAGILSGLRKFSK